MEEMDRIYQSDHIVYKKKHIDNKGARNFKDITPASSFHPCLEQIGNLLVVIKLDDYPPKEFLKASVAFELILLFLGTRG